MHTFNSKKKKKQPKKTLVNRINKMERNEIFATYNGCYFVSLDHLCGK